MTTTTVAPSRAALARLVADYYPAPELALQMAARLYDGSEDQDAAYASLAARLIDDEQEPPVGGQEALQAYREAYEALLVAVLGKGGLATWRAVDL